MSHNNPIAPGVERQRKYIEHQIASGDDGSLVVGAAFVNGIRDLGYVSTATALDELIDNSMQAAATRVDVVFGFEGASDSKPSALAVVDNGFGMIPPMLAYAAKWGGTDREDDRKGFGRYGYGLPSSCVSQGERFRIYSRVVGDKEFHSVEVDLEQIRLNRGENGMKVLAPVPQPAQLPQWLQKHIDEHFDGLPHGTIIVIDKLDRLDWKTRTTLKPKLQQHFGLIYRNYLRDTEIYVDGSKVQPIDPLFLTEGSMYYDLDNDRAEGIDEFRIDAKNDKGEVEGWINVRMSYLPPTFPYVDKIYRKGANQRMKVMEEHEGIIILRNGRQIDVVKRADWQKKKGSFRNVDRYWQVEVDFSADLDQWFSVTTSKQSVKLSERIWNLLEKAGVDQKISDLQRRLTVEIAGVKQTAEKHENDKRLSEMAMENASRFTAEKPKPGESERAEKSKEMVVAEAERKAGEVGIPVQPVLDKLFDEIANRPYAIVTQDIPEGPFYRPVNFGGQRRVILNTDHPFYTELYASPTSTPQVRSALEILLFVLADAELGARDERETFYKEERPQVWSQRLKTALRELIKMVPDDGSIEEEEPAADDFPVEELPATV